MTRVGILVNPSAARDIRRLVARASSMSVTDRCAMIHRMLVGMGTMGVDQVLMMFDRAGIGGSIASECKDAVKRGDDLRLPEIRFLEMPVDGVPEDTLKAVEAGFSAVKDHFLSDADENVEWMRAVRAVVGPDVDLMHDAAGCGYSFWDALRVGRALEELHFRWFEEPLPDRHLRDLQALCAGLDVPVLNPRESDERRRPERRVAYFRGDRSPEGQCPARHHAASEAGESGRPADNLPPS